MRAPTPPHGVGPRGRDLGQSSQKRVPCLKCRQPGPQILKPFMGGCVSRVVALADRLSERPDRIARLRAAVETSELLIDLVQLHADAVEFELPRRRSDRGGKVSPRGFHQALEFGKLSDLWSAGREQRIHVHADFARSPV